MKTNYKKINLLMICLALWIVGKTSAQIVHTNGAESATNLFDEFNPTKILHNGDDIVLVLDATNGFEHGKYLVPAASRERTSAVMHGGYILDPSFIVASCSGPPPQPRSTIFTDTDGNSYRVFDYLKTRSGPASATVPDESIKTLQTNHYSATTITKGYEPKYLDTVDELWHRVLYSNSKEDPKNGFEAKFWPDAIKALHPIKVYSDIGNIVVVQKIENGVEYGKYLEPAYSSQIPQAKDGFIIKHWRLGMMDYERRR